MKKVFIISLLLTLNFTFQTLNSFAQCAMCKAVVESNMKNDANTVGAGLNSGILYLMAFPYMLLLVGGLIWYRSRKLSDTG